NPAQAFRRSVCGGSSYNANRRFLCENNHASTAREKTSFQVALSRPSWSSQIRGPDARRHGGRYLHGGGMGGNNPWPYVAGGCWGLLKLLFYPYNGRLC